MSLAEAVIFSLTAEGFICEMFICAPTVVEPSGKSVVTDFIAAFSINATNTVISKTFISPDPYSMSVFAVLTVVSLLYANPFQT